jgi:hypothetical protein
MQSGAHSENQQDAHRPVQRNKTRPISSRAQSAHGKKEGIRYRPVTRKSFRVCLISTSRWSRFTNRSCSSISQFDPHLAWRGSCMSRISHFNWKIQLGFELTGTANAAPASYRIVASLRDDDSAYPSGSATKMACAFISKAYDRKPVIARSHAVAEPGGRRRTDPRRVSMSTPRGDGT